MKVNQAYLREHATIEMRRHAEEIDWRGYFDDPETEAWIKEELYRGNEWAWCHVTVELSYMEHTVREHLGGCSFKSEEDFRECGYYDDMVTQAVAELAGELESLANDHDLWEHDPVTCFVCAAST